ncbi:MAG TPA: 50S ribosomal protein L11 methyltransferase [Sandaracinaceae bacterium]
MIPRYPTVHVQVSAGDVELASAILWDAGATGIEERDATTLDKSEGADVTLVAHFASDAEAEEAVAALAPRRATVRHIVGDEWKERWKEFFKPTRIGRRLVVRPSWEAFEPGPRDVVITLDPGQAFGTGTHESTRLVLAEVDALVRGGERVLDVGCGSGILSIGALLLGATSALAIDIDPIAVSVTAENAALNGVADRLRAETTAIEEVTGEYELVLANIQSGVLISMAPSLIARVKPGGHLVLSGLLAHESEEMRGAFSALSFVREARDGEWIALVFVRTEG